MRIQWIIIICCIALFISIVPSRGQETKENTDFKLAIGLYNDGMYDLAIDQLHNFISTYQATPQAIEARFYLGLAELKSKKYSEARETFQNFALTYSDNSKAPEAWMDVGKSFEETYNFHEAASAYERIRTFHPKSRLVPEALLMAGTMYYRNGETEPAKNCFKAILRDYSSSSSVTRARISLGEAYAQEGNYTPAFQEIGKAIGNASVPEDKVHALFFSVTCRSATLSPQPRSQPLQPSFREKFRIATQSLPCLILDSSYSVNISTRKPSFS